MQNLRCLVLDIDDTLYLERDYVQSGFAALESTVLEKWQTGGFSETAWRQFEQGVRGNIFNLTLDELGIEYQVADIQELVEAYRQHTPNIQLLDDAREFLDQVAGNYHLAVISDGPLQSQAAKATALQLERWTKHIILTSRLGQGYAKPDPRSYQLIEQQTGIQPQHCVYIADNPKKDFFAPQKLGWKSIRMKRPLSLHENLPSPEFISLEVSDFSEVLKILNQT